MTKRRKFTAELKGEGGTGGAALRQNDPEDRVAP